MKRILLACFLLTAVCTVTSVQHASAQTTVTQASFTVQVNQLDANIAAGDMATAQTTWNGINASMKDVLAVTKASIMNATTALDKSNYTTILNNQTTIYFAVYKLKGDFATNRAAIHSKLQEFDLTIY